MFTGSRELRKSVKHTYIVLISEHIFQSIRSIKEIQYIRIKQEIEAKMEHMSLYNRIYQ